MDSVVASTLGIPVRHLVPLAIFVAYFALILALFTVVIRAIVTSQARPPRPSAVHPAQSTRKRAAWATVFGLAATASLAHTWYHMIHYMLWSYSDSLSKLPFPYPLPPLLSITTWLDRTALFEQAWSLVLQPGVKEWVSSHITGYTVNWALFLWMATQSEPKPLPEGDAAGEDFVIVKIARGSEPVAADASEGAKQGTEAKGKAPVAAATSKSNVGGRGPNARGMSRSEAVCLLLLGQVVAISVASSLSFLVLVLRDRTGLPSRYLRRASVPMSVWLPLLGAAASASIVGWTVNTPYFLANLLLLHFLLFLPFVLPRSAPTPSSPSLHLGAYVLSLLLPLPTLFAPLFLPDSVIDSSTSPEHLSETLPPFTLPTPTLVLNEYRTANHAFGSIAADVAWCGVLVVLWGAYTGRYFGGRVGKEEGKLLGGMWRVQEAVAAAGWYVISGSPGLL